MRIGIVGSEGAKFTEQTEAEARQLIYAHVKISTRVISGGCHLGGIDIWAVEEAKEQGIPFTEYLPKTRNWEGYKARNIQIAENSDFIICITLKELPPGYKAKGFEHYCYHCKTSDHVKSGGCWTVKYGKSIGKDGRIIVI